MVSFWQKECINKECIILRKSAETVLKQIVRGEMQRMDYINAFWVGGLICALVQILMEKTKMMPGRIMVLLVVTGAVISALGWYEPFQDYAGAGASVSVIGLWKCINEGRERSGAGTGIFRTVCRRIQGLEPWEPPQR